MVQTVTLSIILAALIIAMIFADEADAAGLVKRAISTAGTWRITDLPSVTVFNNQSNTYSGSNTQSFGTNAITSGSDPADAGNFRLSNTGTIAWEASPAGTDVDLQVDANEDFLFDTDANNINLNSNPLTNMVLGGTANANGNILDNVASINDNSGAESTSGFIDMANAALLCWEQAPAGADICISVDANEDYLFDTDANNINLNSNPLTNAVLGGSLNANSQKITSLGTPTLSSDAQRSDRLVIGSSLVTSPCANHQVLAFQSSNSTWICSNPRTVLSADVTCTQTGSYCTVFTIPLTNSKSQIIDIEIGTKTNTAGVAVQYRATLDNAGNTGYCLFSTPTTATGAPFDLIAVGTNPADTGETVVIAANVGYPVRIYCSLENDASAGNLLIEMQMELAGTGTAIAGSSYRVTTEP